MTLRQPTFRHGGNARFDEEVTVMVSKAVASLDAWLARAEEVLAEQREKALSPSLASVWDPGQVEMVLSVVGFTETLESPLADLCRRPGRWILSPGTTPHRHRFWQALAFEDGSLVTEVVSNFYLQGDDPWTPDQQERLAALGWEVPDPPRRTNWISRSRARPKTLLKAKASPSSPPCWLRTASGHDSISPGCTRHRAPEDSRCRSIHPWISV
jgi:hypothetical protein